jgi:hypothetical protein
MFGKQTEGVKTILVSMSDVSSSETNAVWRAELVTCLSLVKGLVKSSLVEGEEWR